MTLELWVLVVVAACGAVGGVALLLRQGLRALAWLQMRRLDDDGAALQRWWNAVAEVPADVLTPALRRTIGHIMVRRLDGARRLQPQHPLLRAERLQIARFIRQAPLTIRRTGSGSGRSIAALQALLELLQEAGRLRLVRDDARIDAEATVSRHLTRLEFLRDQHAALEADQLRRLSRALGASAGLRSQLPGGNRAFPTQ